MLLLYSAHAVYVPTPAGGGDVAGHTRRTASPSSGASRSSEARSRLLRVSVAEDSKPRHRRLCPHASLRRLCARRLSCTLRSSYWYKGLWHLMHRAAASTLHVRLEAAPSAASRTHPRANPGSSRPPSAAAAARPERAVRATEHRVPERRAGPQQHWTRASGRSSLTSNVRW